MDKTKITIETYNECAGDYEKKFMDFKLYKTQLLSFYKLLKPRIKVLDLGCGPGNAAKLLIDEIQDVDILGIDLSDEMVAIASKNVPNAKFVIGDLRNLNVTEDIYDVIIASFCLPHLDNIEAEKLLKDVGKLLNKSGLLYLSFMEGETTSFSSDKKIYFNYYSEEYIKKLLIEDGFKIHSTYKQNYPEKDGSFTVDIFITAEKGDDV